MPAREGVREHTHTHHDTVAQTIDDGLALARNSLALQVLGLGVTCRNTSPVSGL